MGWSSTKVRLGATMVAAAALCVGVVPVSNAGQPSTNDRVRVSEIIVRYQAEAPATTKNGLPWGAQCVPRAHRTFLRVDRDIGARMRVLRVKPAISPNLAREIAQHLDDCPFVEWAEADIVTFTIG